MNLTAKLFSNLWNVDELTVTSKFTFLHCRSALQLQEKRVVWRQSLGGNFQRKKLLHNINNSLYYNHYFYFNIAIINRIRCC